MSSTHSRVNNTLAKYLKKLSFIDESNDNIEKNV